MDLFFGTPVFERDRKAGTLAGLEVDPAAGRVRKIVFSRNGQLGSGVQTRAIEIVRTSDGKIVVDIDEAAPSGPLPFRLEPVLWSRGTHVIRGHDEIGRVCGARLEPRSGRIEAVVARKSWWKGSFELPADRLDLTVLGEVRVGAGSRAA